MKHENVLLEKQNEELQLKLFRLENKISVAADYLSGSNNYKIGSYVEKFLRDEGDCTGDGNSGLSGVMASSSSSNPNSSNSSILSSRNRSNAFRSFRSLEFDITTKPSKSSIEALHLDLSEVSTILSKALSTLEQKKYGDLSSQKSPPASTKKSSKEEEELDGVKVLKRHQSISSSSNCRFEA